MHKLSGKPMGLHAKKVIARTMMLLATAVWPEQSRIAGNNLARNSKGLKKNSEM
jgi:hypothetical protein